MGLGKQSTTEARESLERDRELGEHLPELLRSVAEAQQALDAAREGNVPAEEEHRLGMVLDAALTDAMRAAYAQERTLIGAKGYTDRIHRRKRLARPKVSEVTDVAERLLTARETHRIHGIQRVPPRV